MGTLHRIPRSRPMWEVIARMRHAISVQHANFPDARFRGISCFFISPVSRKLLLGA